MSLKYTLYIRFGMVNSINTYFRLKMCVFRDGIFRLKIHIKCINSKEYKVILRLIRRTNSEVRNA